MDSTSAQDNAYLSAAETKLAEFEKSKASHSRREIVMFALTVRRSLKASGADAETKKDVTKRTVAAMKKAHRISADRSYERLAQMLDSSRGVQDDVPPILKDIATHAKRTGDAEYIKMMEKNTAYHTTRLGFDPTLNEKKAQARNQAPAATVVSELEKTKRAYERLAQMRDNASDVQQTVPQLLKDIRAHAAKAGDEAYVKGVEEGIDYHVRRLKFDPALNEKKAEAKLDNPQTPAEHKTYAENKLAEFEKSKRAYSHSDIASIAKQIRTHMELSDATPSEKKEIGLRAKAAVRNAHNISGGESLARLGQTYRKAPREIYAPLAKDAREHYKRAGLSPARLKELDATISYHIDRINGLTWTLPHTETNGLSGSFLKQSAAEKPAETAAPATETQKSEKDRDNARLNKVIDRHL